MYKITFWTVQLQMQEKCHKCEIERSQLWQKVRNVTKKIELQEKKSQIW